MATSPTMRIFQDACETLAEVLKPYGFKYRKSVRQACREGKLFEHVVSFGTSRMNSLDHILLEVRAMAWGSQLKTYREKAGKIVHTEKAVLFGSTIENLFHPAPPYIRYNIAGTSSRKIVLDSIATVLRNDVLRAFEIAEDPAAFRAAAEGKSMPCLIGRDVQDYFACFGECTAT